MLLGLDLLAQLHDLLELFLDLGVLPLHHVHVLLQHFLQSEFLNDLPHHRGAEISESRSLLVLFVEESREKGEDFRQSGAFFFLL